MTQPSILLENMSFTWSGRTKFNLKIPEFRLEKGEKLLLLGSSGSGKSTLLNLICGIAQPDAGRGIVEGSDLSQLGGAARDKFRADHIGVIFQMFNLLPFTTPLENILLPLKFSKSRRARLPDPKAEALRLTGALGLDADLVRNARSDELSIGQQQRVAAARALIGGPQLIVADEPTSALDADAQAGFVDLLMAQVAEADASLLMVSHDERLAPRFDRVVRLQDLTAQA